MLTRIDDRYTLSVPSFVDAGNLEEFFTHLQKIESADVREVVLDCSHVKEASTRYLAILCQAHSELRRAGIAVHLVSVSDDLEKILTAHNIFHLFEQVPQNRSEVCQPDGGSEGRSRKMIELSFQPIITDISEAFEIYKTFLNDSSINELEVFELMTVFYEVVTNIRLHGKLPDNARIDFSALLYLREILMRFEDAGIPFDPGNRLFDFDPHEAVRTGKKRGLGIILIRRLTDSLSYMRGDDGKNILCLKKNLSNGVNRNDTSSNHK